MKLVEINDGILVPIEQCVFQVKECDPSDTNLQKSIKFDETIKEFWPNVWTLKVGWTAQTTAQWPWHVLGYFETKEKAIRALESIGENND